MRGKEASILATDYKLKIAVCDDMEKDRVQISGMAAQILRDARIPHRIFGFDCAKALLDEIRSGARFDFCCCKAFLLCCKRTIMLRDIP